MPRQQIKLSVDPDTYKSLKKEAVKANLPISTFIRKTLQDVLLNEGLPVIEPVKVSQQPVVNLMEQAIEEEVAEVADLTEKLFTVSDIVAAQQDSMKKESAANNMVESAPIQVKDGSATIEAEDKEKGKTVKITINMW